jgi:hypothetical protein
LSQLTKTKEGNKIKNDAERLRDFKELRGSIRTNPDYLILGIDVAKLRHHTRFIIGSGRIV